ncbi:MAG: DUF4268 domain-containing protein [Flavobacteriaceae bacterium]|nr:DUF4268 domain-containing protein [Flavobacteriaceae bacterium]
MYHQIVKALFERNPKLLIENQEVIKISKNSEDFRSPSEISNGYYIESNTDSRSKFNYLKKLLSIYDLEDELSIKYQDDATRSFSKSRHKVRNDYWKRILNKLEGTELFANVKPSKDHWLSTGAGKTGISYTMVISRKYARIELTLSSSKKENNKQYFNQLLAKKDKIENIFGNQLEWELLPESKMSRIKFEITHVNLFDENTWDEMDKFFIEYLPKFESAFKEYLLIL